MDGHTCPCASCGVLMRTTLTWAVLAALCSCATTSVASSSDGPATAAELSHGYLRQWSFRGRDALQTVNQAYAPRVLFYGRVLAREQLYQQKLRFIRRWPVRRYVLRPDTVRVSCPTSASCRVSGIMDWRVERKARVARGSSTFVQGFVLSPSPQIVSESGRVLARRR